MIDCAPDMYAIIFTRTKMDAREIARKLQKDGIDCDALHGDLSQAQRDDVMDRFRAKRLKVLVATDVAARGLDVDNLTHVINYNLPEDVESYTHRSGRTGRAGREEVCRAQLSYYADKILMTEPKETLDKYRHELFEKFEELSKEELIQKMMSYEFGKLLKKYASVADLNLSDEERHDGGRREKRRGERKNEESVTFTTFSVNVGKEDGFTPRDLMTIINENAPRKGLEIGSIRIFDNNTKFEVDVRGINGFMSCFRNVSFNGLPFTLSEVKDRYNRSDRGGERRSSANRRSDGSSRGRFGEKKKGIESGGRSRKKR